MASSGETRGHAIESEIAEIDIERFSRLHPALNSDLLVEPARVALAKYHQSPAAFLLHRDKVQSRSHVRFSSPDPRSGHTLEREDFVEKGAIVMAGLLLAHYEGKLITRVLKRGDRVDYFVGEHPGDSNCILEVGGTDEQSFESCRGKKHSQLADSPFRLRPHQKDGFVGVTRFAPEAASALDFVPAAR